MREINAVKFKADNGLYSQMAGRICFVFRPFSQIKLSPKRFVRSLISTRLILSYPRASGFSFALICFRLPIRLITISPIVPIRKYDTMDTAIPTQAFSIPPVTPSSSVTPMTDETLVICIHMTNNVGKVARNFLSIISKSPIQQLCR